MVGTGELCNSLLENVGIFLEQWTWSFFNVHVVELVSVVASITAVDNRILRSGIHLVGLGTAVRRREVAVYSIGPAPEGFPQNSLHGWHTGTDLQKCVSSGIMDVLSGPMPYDCNVNLQRGTYP